MLSARPISLNADVDIPAHTILNTKTPGRKALKGRNVLQENAIHSGARTVISKKNVLQTPFRPGTIHGKKQAISVSVTRPLMDKTPFPNRTAAGSFANAGKTPGLKLSKLALFAESELDSLSPDVAPLLRPSSTRKSLRGRLSQNFKTPLTKGNHWDVSPGDMEGFGTELVQEAQQVTNAIVVEEDDELEYMPPTAVERPYEPLFDLPDYKSLGHQIFGLGHGPIYDDTADTFYAADIEKQLDVRALLNDAGPVAGPSKLDDLKLPELDDDSPFARMLSTSKSATAATAPAGNTPLARASSTRAVPTRTAPPPRPATTIPSASHSRSSSRTNPSPATGASVLALAPGQTRTSALRAAKNAAAASNSTTLIPIRPATSAGVRATSSTATRRVTPTTSTTSASKLPTRAATTAGVGGAATRHTTTGAGSTTRTRSATTSVHAAPVISRSRSATVVGRPGVGSGVASASGKNKRPDDSLADMLEKEFGDGEPEDFRFDV